MGLWDLPNKWPNKGVTEVITFIGDITPFITRSGTSCSLVDHLDKEF